MLKPRQTHTTEPLAVRTPVRSLILNVSPCLHGIIPAHRQEIIQELRRHLRRMPLEGGRVVDNAKGVHLIWTWGDCTADDTDLTSPAEVSGLLASLHTTTQNALSQNNPLVQARITNPVFKEAMAHAVNTAQKIKQLCHTLSTNNHINATPPWQEKFGLKGPLECRFGLCHGKLFNLGEQLNGLSLDVASDMARMAPKGGLACGPIVRHTLEALFKEPGAIDSFSHGKNPKIKSLNTQLIPSAQIECPLWEIFL